MSGLTGIVKGLPEHEYHAHPALSSSGVRDLLPRFKGSPKRFKWNRTHPKTSKAFDLGKAVHARVLGVGAEAVTYPDEHLTPSGNVSTSKATKDWEVEQSDAGLIVVTATTLEQIDGMAEAVLAHRGARPYLEVAVHRELSVFADVDGVPCRARFDAISDDTRRGVIAVDLKTAPDATENGFTRSVQKWGYDVQEAHYREVYEASEGKPIDTFMFVVVETSPPFEVGLRPLADSWVLQAKDETRRARDIFRDCTERNDWPGYDEQPTPLAAPMWAAIAHDDEYGELELQL